MDSNGWDLPVLITLLGMAVTGFIASARAAFRADRRRRKRRFRYRPHALREIDSNVDDPARRSAAAASARGQAAAAPEGADACTAGWGILRDGVVVESYASEQMARRRFRALIASQLDATREAEPEPAADRKLRSAIFVIPPR